jgi:hypothetical protein
MIVRKKTKFIIVSAKFLLSSLLGLSMGMSMDRVGYDIAIIHIFILEVNEFFLPISIFDNLTNIKILSILILSGTLRIV